MRSTSLLCLLLTAAVCSAANIPKKAASGNKEDRLPKECGKSIKDGISIYGGVNATSGELPWMALLGNRDGYNCGGSLISDRFVLTASHCGNMTKVRLGAIFRKPNNDDKKHLKEYKVERTIMHKKGDIALLRLKEKVVFTDFIRPICLPSADHKDKTLARRKADIAGWGLTDKHSISGSPRLMKANVTVTSLAECKEKYEGVNAVIDESVVCAGGEKGRMQDTCSGDSGGPLYLRLDHQSVSRWTQVGVTSFGVECGSEKYPGVYTSVSYFRGWILDNMV